MRALHRLGYLPAAFVVLATEPKPTIELANPNPLSVTTTLRS